MKNFLSLCIVFFAFSTVMADQSSTRISPASESGSGCDLVVAGITDKNAFLDFFRRLKAAAIANDAKKMASLVLFPLRANFDKPEAIKNKKIFLKRYSAIFPTPVINAIKSQEVDKLFCRDQGVMIGTGEVWIIQSGNKIGISTVNIP